jgi:hypothetical protein
MPGTEKSPKIRLMKAPTICPPGRSRPLPDNMKSLPGTGPEIKMVVFDERSFYVYENTRNDDNKAEIMADIFGSLESI